MHIIAPPGSGKTVLGLEVMLRLNKPTLILAPTLAIKNQWIQRFCELFIQNRQEPDWISRDIRKPGFLTVSTYQALHTAMAGIREDEEQWEIEEEEDNKRAEQDIKESCNVLETLLLIEMGTIVVDEAHHLKNAWWESLIQVKNTLQPSIVGLTATPPYDVSYPEWHRYLQLNGPVDTEISVPELILEEDLCPHQDYLYFSLPTKTELDRIKAYRKRLQELKEKIVTDEILTRAIQFLPIISEPQEHLEWIYTNLEIYSASLIYLNEAGHEITREQLEVIGNKIKSLPKLSFDWLEILLNYYLFEEPERFLEFEAHQLKLMNQLRQYGALERKRVKLEESETINKSLTSSISKLESISPIVNFEWNSMQQDLRLVILSDFIRKEYLAQGPEASLDKIGVIPIFESLRRLKPVYRMGVLTGSLVILPAASLLTFTALAKERGLEQIKSSPLPLDPDYHTIVVTDQLRKDMVYLVTQLFESGGLHVLTGTKSLLGEGWDAPCINALILASFVGSFVLSNQMRGRAIRTHKINRDKTANIWHLACLDPSVPDGGSDLETLKRRFKGFVGVSMQEEVSIENGIGRFQLPKHLAEEETLLGINEQMLDRAGQRQELKAKWKKALASGKTLIEEIKVPFPSDQNYKNLVSLYYTRTIVYMVAVLSSLVAIYAEATARSIGRLLRYAQSPEEFTQLLLVVLGSALVFFGRQLYLTTRMYLKFRDITKDINGIGEALLKSYIQMNLIKTPVTQLAVEATVDKLGTIFCHLEGGTTFEKSTFIAGLQEVIDTVENPRYLIIRKSKFARLYAQKDYHAVPEALGKKKRNAEYFEAEWRRLVGNCELVYTRTIEGRKILLQSRLGSLAAQFQARSERINKWK